MLSRDSSPLAYNCDLELLRLPCKLLSRKRIVHPLLVYCWLPVWKAPWRLLSHEKYRDANFLLWIMLSNRRANICVMCSTHHLSDRGEKRRGEITLKALPLEPVITVFPCLAATLDLPLAEWKWFEGRGNHTNQVTG